MHLVDLYTYCRMMHGAYNVKISVYINNLYSNSIRSEGHIDHTQKEEMHSKFIVEILEVILPLGRLWHILRYNITRTLYPIDIRP